MNPNIEIFKYPRARLGWHQCHKILDHLGRGDLKIPFIYFFENHELLLIDPQLIEILEFLKIPYTLIKPSQAIKYIKES